MEQPSSIPQILLFMQIHLLQRSFLSTTCIIPSPVPFPSQDSSFQFVLPTLAFSTSPAPFFLSTRQWHFLWLDRASGNTSVLHVLLALHTFLYLLTYLLTHRLKSLHSNVNSTIDAAGIAHFWNNLIKLCCQRFWCLLQFKNVLQWLNFQTQQTYLIRTSMYASCTFEIHQTIFSSIN